MAFVAEASQNPHHINIQKLVISNCYVSVKSHAKGELFPLSQACVMYDGANVATSYFAAFLTSFYHGRRHRGSQQGPGTPTLFEWGIWPSQLFTGSDNHSDSHRARNVRIARGSQRLA